MVGHVETEKRKHASPLKLGEIMSQHVKYEGPAKVHEFFSCAICGEQSKFKYIKYPHPSVEHLYEEKDKTPKQICKKCAKREIGTKNVKGWKEIHGETETTK